MVKAKLFLSAEIGFISAQKWNVSKELVLSLVGKRTVLLLGALALVSVLCNLPAAAEFEPTGSMPLDTVATNNNLLSPITLDQSIRNTRQILPSQFSRGRKRISDSTTISRASKSPAAYFKLSDSGLLSTADRAGFQSRTGAKPATGDKSLSNGSTGDSAILRPQTARLDDRQIIAQADYPTLGRSGSAGGGAEDSSSTPGAASVEGNLIGATPDVSSVAPDASSTSGSEPAEHPPATQPIEQPPAVSVPGVARRAPPAPLDPVFPMTEWIGVNGMLPTGVPDSDPQYPLQKALWKACPILRSQRIRVYGWANAGWGWGTSKHSNFPLSYYLPARHLELDQLVLRAERVPDTVQTDHVDWGFRCSLLYGIDYRFTTAAGWYPASRQLLQHNYLYGFDPVELYGVLYIPKVAKGMTLKAGRFISPPDIEAQLSPDNFLWTHSQMFTVDNYTQTGLLATVQLTDQIMAMAGISAGADIAPWNRAAIPTALAHLKWVSKSNNDSLFGGMNSINSGGYRNVPNNQHDNLQQFNLTWGHRFNKRGTIVTFTEGYYIYQNNALVGGTVIYGPPRTFFGLTGPGAPLPGTSPAWGLVNYTAFKVTPKDYICIRPVDFLGDCRGERTGFPTTYSTWTLGWCHRFSDLLCIRPEIRYERALNYHDGMIVKPYDNGTRRYQFTIGADLIQRF